MIYSETDIKQRFKKYIQDITLKHVLLILLLSVVFLGYYMYSDWYIRNNLYAFYTRFLPLTIGLPLFVLMLAFKQKYRAAKMVLYHIYLGSAAVMMYIICLIHLHNDALAPSVTGTLLVIFLLSLEIKTRMLNTALIYFLPLLAFTISLVFFFNPTKEEFTILADIYPIIVVGFAINRIQYQLRFKAFRSGFLLDQEKQKTDALYQETLVINEDLHSKTEEIVAHKEEIEEKNQKLLESNATKDKFFAVISHDLISPFNILMGFSDLLLESFKNNDTEDQQKCVAYIHENVHKTYQLVENLLMWAKSQKEGLSFQIEKLNIFRVATEVTEILKQAAHAKTIQIENRIREDLVVGTDKNILSTILRNILSNAIKFTPANGQVFLDARIQSETKEQPFLEIIVRDTGVGIPLEAQSKLFNISEKVSTKGTEQEKGTGLGLILCKDFVEKLGGKIWLESETGTGSQFSFSIPFNV